MINVDTFIISLNHRIDRRIEANKELVRKIKQNFTIFDFAENPF